LNDTWSADILSRNVNHILRGLPLKSCDRCIRVGT